MTAHPFDWDNGLPPETEDEVYGALLRALQRKQGFGLFFVQCSKDQGNKIVAKLRQDLPQQRIEELHLQDEVTTLYDQIATLWQQPFDVLVIEGLQASLYAYEDTKRFSGWSSSDVYHYSWKGVPKILNHLNQQREHLRNDFPARFVFLVPPFVVDYFIQRAADFLDWRSGLFRFPRDSKEIEQDTEQYAAEDDTNYRALSPQQRIEKILELKSLQEICLDAESKPKLLFELGLLYNAEQDYGNAVISYDKALEIRLDYHKAWYKRGTALSALGRKEEAIASYDNALEIKPDYHEAWYNRGNALSALGRKEEAIASYDKALEIKPDKHEPWNNRGNALSALGLKKEAIASYDKALEIKPDKHEAWYNRGYALSALGLREEAIASYDKALEIKPDYHAAWNNRGYALSALGLKEEAIASYDKVLEIKLDDDKAWNNRGIVLSDLGRNEEAIASYDKALEIKPDYYPAWNSRGNVLKYLERYEEAIDSYNRAIEINPEYRFPWSSRAVALMKLGQFEAAHESFDQAILLVPDNAGVQYDKACCFGLEGKQELAIELLQHVIDLDSEYRDMAKTDSDFDSIRDDARFRALIGE